MKGKEKIVIQAKRYSAKNRVSLSAVQEVYAAKAYYKANQAWVVTNSYFTKQAKELAAACDVTLVDRADLQKFINEVNPVFKAREIFENITPEPRKCPKCGQESSRTRWEWHSFFWLFLFPFLSSYREN